MIGKTSLRLVRSLGQHLRTVQEKLPFPEIVQRRIDDLSNAVYYHAGMRPPATGSLEKQKMLAGKPFDYRDPGLVSEREWSRYLRAKYNRTSERQVKTRTRILKALLGSVGPGVTVWPTFYCEYGGNIYLGENVFINAGCLIIDANTVTVGDNSLLGPNVQLLTPVHPINPSQRRSGVESAQPITIGDNVWIGAGSIVLPNVTIGPNTIIGAGAVVTEDIPANVVAVGKPCKFLKHLERT